MVELLTSNEIAKMLKVSKKTIYRMIDDGRLRGSKIGKEWRFKKDKLEKWLERQERKYINIE